MLRDRLRAARESVPRVLLGRSAVVGVMLALAAVVVLSFLAGQWTNAGRALADAAITVGLDNVFRTWWFLVIVAVATVQLALVTYRLAKRDLRRLRRVSGPSSGQPFEVEDVRAFEAALHAERYLRLSSQRFVKNPWGYLGPSLLHAGMLLVVLSAISMNLTTSTGLLSMTSGESLPAGTPLTLPQRGLIGAEPVLPEQLTFDGLRDEYWSDGEIRSVYGTYTVGEAFSARTFEVGINHPVVVNGTRYFQERFGYAFFVSLVRGDDLEKRRLNLPEPNGPGVPSYQDLELENGDLLRAKMFVDEPAQTPPRLTLRLMRDGEVIGEETLESTATVTLGDTTVTVDYTSRWAVIVLERGNHMWLFGLAAFVIFVGALLIYLTPPREVTIVRLDDGSTAAFWYAARFGPILSSEAKRLREAADGGGPDVTC